MSGIFCGFIALLVSANTGLGMKELPDGAVNEFRNDCAMG
jgi:hypothetical protein